MMYCFSRIVEKIDNLKTMFAFLNKLGQDHASYGVIPKYYTRLQESFNKTLRFILRSDYSSDLEKAWDQVFQYLIKIMKGQNYEARKLCELCERVRPVFVVDKDNALMHQQDDQLPPFLRNLKQDFVQKKDYLKLLKVKSSFVRSCACQDRFFHSYCATASIIR